MTQRELTLNKHLESVDEDIDANMNFHESVRDAIHDAMKEHAIEFAKMYSDTIMETAQPPFKRRLNIEQLYNIFNLNKEINKL